MKRFLLCTLSLALLLGLVMSSNELMAKKKKRKKRKAKSTKVVSASKDSIKVVRSPGVPNQNVHDSLKYANKIEKLKSANDALVVSFISLSSGIDVQSATRLEVELEAFNKKSECGILFEKKNWGREGERDYCILSSDPKCMSEVTEMIRLKFSGNRRILIKEHSTCK